MFEPSAAPRVFAVAPGIDFPEALVAGLRTRMEGQPPEAMARVELIVNTTRMARRIRQIFDRGPATLLPRIRLLSNVADPIALSHLPAPVSPLRRRLELTGLVSGLLDAQPDLAPRTALFDLADSLATLMDEMQDEGVSPEDIAALDVSDESGHWQRALSFLNIVQRYFDTAEDAPDTTAFRRLALQQRLFDWEETPPTHPVILAGSTGSRGMTNRLMQAVSKLPQGALVLPGFDFDTPESVWHGLTDALASEDHPQFRFAKLVNDLGMQAGEVLRWSGAEPPSAARNRLISLALRPAPVTDQWRDEGPMLPDLIAATEDLTLVEAASQRDEATAIALRLRQAAEEGVTAALITPDRMLTRQVTAALDRWNILPDDSAGMPLQLSPPGRFLRHVAALFVRKLDAEALLVEIRVESDASYLDKALLTMAQARIDRGEKGIAKAVLFELREQAPASELQAEAILEEIRLLVIERKWTEAITKYDKWLKTYPQHKNRTEVLFDRTWALAQSGKFRDAAKLFEELMEGSPNIRQTHMARMWLADRAYNSRTNQLEAEKLYMKIRGATNCPPSLRHRAGMMAGRAAMERQAFKDARKTFETLIDEVQANADKGSRRVHAEASFALGDLTMMELGGAAQDQINIKLYFFRLKLIFPS